jgi:hypothetical protein
MKSQIRHYLATGITAALLLSNLLLFTSNALAEECPKKDFSSLFFEEYYGDIKWDNKVSPKEITWSTEVSVVEGEPIARQLTPSESEWLQESFDSWDIALDTIDFKRVADAKSANVIVGMVPINYNGFWSVEQRGNFRIAGSIKLSTVSPFLSTRNGFIEAAQSEIGNLLGLGDIPEKADMDSVMKDPDTAPYGVIPLSDFDIELIRQLYGESTCKSDWSQPLRDSKAAAQAAIDAAVAADKAAATAALAKAAADAQAKLDAENREAMSRVALEAEIARKAQEKIDRSELAAFKASLKAKKSITCVKGKLVKKVSGVNPACPKGYTKR